MTLASDWRMYAAMQLHRLLTQWERRTVDRLRRDGYKLPVIIQVLARRAELERECGVDRKGEALRIALNEIGTGDAR